MGMTGNKLFGHYGMCLDLIYGDFFYRAQSCLVHWKFSRDSVDLAPHPLGKGGVCIDIKLIYSRTKFYCYLWYLESCCIR